MAPIEDPEAASETFASNSEKDFLLWRRLQLSKAKLKGVTEMAALMSGFSVVKFLYEMFQTFPCPKLAKFSFFQIATVELTIKKGTNEFLLVSFALATSLLVSTTMLSIMIATCVHPHLESIAKLESISLLKKSPHDSVSFYIDLAWFLANTVSIFLFIVDIILLCWIKFDTTPAVFVTSIMIPVLLLLCVFSIIFYRKTVVHQIHVADKKLDELKALSVRLRLIPQDDEDGDAVAQDHDFDLHGGGSTDGSFGGGSGSLDSVGSCSGSGGSAPILGATRLHHQHHPSNLRHNEISLHSIA